MNAGTLLVGAVTMFIAGLVFHQDYTAAALILMWLGLASIAS